MSHKPTLILIPGLLSDEVVWKHIVDALKNEINIVVADISHSDSIVDMAKGALAQAGDDLALNAGTLYVAGHSLGARVAIELYRLEPDRVKKLALIDTGTHPLAEGEIEKRQIILDLAREEGMQALADAWLPPMVHQNRHNDFELMNTLYAMVLRADVAQHDRQIKALINRPDANVFLPKIKCPVLLAVGRQDKWSPVTQHEDMLSKLENAHLVVLEDAGHFAPIEQPEAMTKALTDWLKRSD